MRINSISVVVPNWNGADHLKECIDSLVAQSVKAHIIVVDNGSTDSSLQILGTYDQVEVIQNRQNKGFAGGVNDGFRRAIELNHDFVAAFNNDAVADKDWLRHLLAAIEANPAVGAVTCKFLNADGKRIDSTGDYYTVWGLAYPRGREETNLTAYDKDIEVFGASGGASLYRTKMLKEIGLFDEDFFAYYEDVDLSFRAQLFGWKIRYVPEAVAYHHIGATSGKIKGFATYQTAKNLQLLFAKNIPRRLLWRVGWRFTFASCLIFLSSFSRRQGWSAIKGDLQGTFLLIKKLGSRWHIQRHKKASSQYIWELLVHDLPPNARKLRKLRSLSWRIRGKRT